MLKKRLRLRAAEVDEVLKKGHSTRSAHMQVKVLSDNEHLRSAAVVAKALAHKANIRNALRRSLYRALATTPHPKAHGRAIFFLRLIPKEQPAKVIKEEVAFLLSKIS